MTFGDTWSGESTDAILAPAGAEECLHLTLVWEREATGRLGETIAVPFRGLFGRGEDGIAGDPPRLELVRQRPGENLPTGTLRDARLSRRQLIVEPRGDGLQLTNIGKRSVALNGEVVTECMARVGDCLMVAGAYVLLVELRPRLLPGSQSEVFPFGFADADGIIGESPVAWQLRHQLRAAGQANAHVLITGPSGTGKELCARAIHRMSSRGDKPWVARNAASIPNSLIEAELFGNAPHYPNAGMPGRLGLLGQANGTSLFLDEVGELSQAEQANLLRVLDEGEYQRLGEDRPRRVEFRLVAATNRGLEALKHDFLARFMVRVNVAGLALRRADLPLLVRAIGEKLGGREHKVSTDFLVALMQYDFPLNHRELERLVRESVDLGGAVPQELLGGRAPSEHPEVSGPREVLAPRAGEPSPAEIEAALAAAPTIVAAAAALGLTSRFALYRLMKKHNIPTTRDESVAAKGA